MRFIPAHIQSTLFILFVTQAFSSVTFAQQKTLYPGDFVNWLPVTEAQIQLKAPLVEKDAGVEALEWRVHVVDEFLGNGAGEIQRVSYNYVRLKVFDEKGKERVSTIDLFYGNHGNIMSVSARTIKPDGTVLELPAKSIFRRDVVRAGGLRRNSVSFALPGVEPGVIIDYRYREVLDDNRIRFTRLEFQRDYPIERMTYFVKPLSARNTTEEMRLMPFNCKPTPITYTADGYSSTSVQNVPAYHSETYAPDQWVDGAWALLYYSQGSRNNPEKYWNELGKQKYGEMKAELKVDDEIKAATAKAIAGAKTDEEKVTKLITYMRKNLRNAANRTEVTDAERAKLIESMPRQRSRTAAEIFRSGMGYANEMNIAFAAMAMQAGLDVRPALVSDRNMPFSEKATMEAYFLPNVDMAVKLGDKWKVYDVSRKLLSPDMLSYTEEGQPALITDPKTPVFINTPETAPEASVEERSARLELFADGHIEGNVSETLTGHKAEEYRRQEGEKAVDEQEADLKERLGHLFFHAEVAAITIRNVDDSVLPIEIIYHLRADFAQRTGKRLLIQPIAFRHAIVSPFAAADRRRSIDMRYAWTEIDRVTITLPKGYELDNPDSPGSVSFGAAGGYDMKMTINKVTNELTTVRTLKFGSNGARFFLPTDYPAVKKVFDDIHTRDRHTLSVKEGE